MAVVFGTIDPATGRLQLQVFPCLLVRGEDLDGLELAPAEIDDEDWLRDNHGDDA